jgi:hypothetical protein
MLKSLTTNTFIVYSTVRIYKNYTIMSMIYLKRLLAHMVVRTPMLQIRYILSQPCSRPPTIRAQTIVAGRVSIIYTTIAAVHEKQADAIIILRAEYLTFTLRIGGIEPLICTAITQRDISHSWLLQQREIHHHATPLDTNNDRNQISREYTQVCI